MRPKLTITPPSLRQFSAETRRLSEKDVKIAASWALNDTAQDVLRTVQEGMRRRFDRPTRFTLNAFYVWRASPSRLEAVVQERSSMSTRHYLKIEEAGGARPQTGVERALSLKLKYDGIIRSAIPAQGAKLDAYGNWSSGERNQALSAVQSQLDEKSNTTEASRKRNKRRAGYFVPRKGAKLSPGIWRRDTTGAISKVLHFSDTSPRYKPALGFYQGAEDVYRMRLPQHLARTLAKLAAKRSS